MTKRKRVGDLKFTEPSKTKQEFRDISMPSNVVRQFERTGDPMVLQARNARYMDLSQAPYDYAEALIFVREAQEAFLALPAELREEFGNDPGEFLDAYETATPEERQALGVATEADFEAIRANAAKKEDTEVPETPPSPADASPAEGGGGEP